MDMDEKDNPRPGIAESVDISEDKKTYTFICEYQIGLMALTDYREGFLRIVGKRTAPFSTPIQPATSTWSKMDKRSRKVCCPMINLGVKALDDRTLQVELLHPTPYFLAMTANGNLCRSQAY